MNLQIVGAALVGALPVRGRPRGAPLQVLPCPISNRVERIKQIPGAVSRPGTLSEFQFPESTESGWFVKSPSHPSCSQTFRVGSLAAGAFVIVVVPSPRASHDRGDRDRGELNALSPYLSSVQFAPGKLIAERMPISSMPVRSSRQVLALMRRFLLRQPGPVSGVLRLSPSRLYADRMSRRQPRCRPGLEGCRTMLRIAEDFRQQVIA